jgi:hypothetical protein
MNYTGTHNRQFSSTEIKFEKKLNLGGGQWREISKEKKLNLGGGQWSEN